MRSESNRGIFIFWITIAIVIVAVILFFVIPRNDPYFAYNSVLSVEQNTNENDFYNKSYNNYFLEVQSVSLISMSNKTALDNIVKVQSVLLSSNNFTKTAFAFIYNGEDYNNLSAEVKNASAELNLTIDNFQSYCKTTIKPFLATTNKNMTTANEIIKVFVDRYFDLTKKYADYYTATSNFIEKCAIQCIEVNSTIINSNKNIASMAKTILSASVENLDASAINSLETMALSTYNSTFYQSHFN